MNSIRNVVLPVRWACAKLELISLMDYLGLNRLFVEWLYLPRSLLRGRLRFPV